MLHEVICYLLLVVVHIGIYASIEPIRSLKDLAACTIIALFWPLVDLYLIGLFIGSFFVKPKRF